MRDRVRIHSRGCQPAAADKVCRTDDKGSTASGPPPRLPTCQPPVMSAAVAAQLEAGATAAVAAATAAHRHRARRAVLERAMAEEQWRRGRRRGPGGRSACIRGGRSAGGQRRRRERAGWRIARRCGAAAPRLDRGAAGSAWQPQAREAALASRRSLQGHARGCTRSYAQPEEPQEPLRAARGQRALLSRVSAREPTSLDAVRPDQVGRCMDWGGAKCLMALRGGPRADMAASRARWPFLFRRPCCLP